jgi:sRNA-binding carbon storage regulator CsrA
MPRLVLSRIEGQSIELDGPGTVTLHQNHGRRSILVIDAPATTKVMRTEIVGKPKTVSSETVRKVKGN